MTVNDPGDLWLHDATALRAELTSLRARQEVLADALAAAGDELEKIRAEDALIVKLTQEALEHLNLDYEEGSRIDRAVQAIEAIQVTASARGRDVL